MPNERKRGRGHIKSGKVVRRKINPRDKRIKRNLVHLSGKRSLYESSLTNDIRDHPVSSGKNRGGLFYTNRTDLDSAT
jgi:hypothetical protein